MQRMRRNGLWISAKMPSLQRRKNNLSSKRLEIWTRKRNERRRRCALQRLVRARIWFLPWRRLCEITSSPPPYNEKIRQRFKNQSRHFFEGCYFGILKAYSSFRWPFSLYWRKRERSRWPSDRNRSWRNANSRRARQFWQITGNH